MQFAIFGSAQAGSERSGANLGEGFHDFVEFNVEAEALGYCATFLVEHHFTGWNQVSATLQLMTWLAARTTTLRLGTAVMVLPWHNPVLLAEQAAMLDLMSGGRLDFGIGKGYRHMEFEGFCIPPEEAQARFDEALEIILKSWTTRERFSHDGRFWRFKNVVVEPRPKQDRGEAPDIKCRRCGIRDAQRRRLDREPAAFRARGQAARGRARPPRCNGRLIGRSNLGGAALRRGTR
jgi:alkanesulfonate monooxygenase SsuD/methylene tetrahydromethanopterin reductase-like flavin-dependent oxidoreductase (luciferase family)